MITEVSLEKFKSIYAIKNLKMKPLTIFTGENSTGKSNILEGIALFAEAARLSQTPGNEDVPLSRIFMQGDIKRYPWREIQDYISYKKKLDNNVTIKINVASDNSLLEELEEIYKEYENQFITNEVHSVGFSLTFRFLDQYISQSSEKNGKTILRAFAARGQSFVIENEARAGRLATNAGSVFGKNVFRLAENLQPNAQELKSQNEMAFKSQIAQAILSFIRKQCEKMYLISGERGNIDAEFIIQQPRMPREREPCWVGSKGQYLLEILSRLTTKEPEKAELIREWANKFQIPEIRAGYVGEGKLESNFKDKQFNINLNSALAGLGSRQIMSIIVQIFSAEPGSVLMIEEPEISLHPDKQVLLHELFATAIKQGKQIICTTHSPFLILSLSKIVRKKMLSVEDIAVYHVEKDSEGTRVKELDLDKHGFLKGGVPSFMKTERELFQDWSESLEEE